MITDREFTAMKCLIETENQLIKRFDSFVKSAKEPQLREDMQKISASLKNQKANLIGSLEDNRDK